MTNGVFSYVKRALKSENTIQYNESRIERIFKVADCDVQIYHMRKGKVLFIEPARNPEAYKCYYLLAGSARDLETEQVFLPGDALLTHKMETIVSLLVEQDTQMLVHAFGVSIENEILINKDKLNDLMEDLFMKDPYEKGHAIRVFEMVKILGIQLGFGGERLYALNKAARFFDIGKIHIDEELLRKETALTYDEIEIIRFHVTMSDKLVRYYYGLNTSPGILEHHECWDGSGYPVGMSGEEISLEARLIAICDSFDAMCQERPYRHAKDPHQALEEIAKCAGTKYDPDLVQLFKEAYLSGRFDEIMAMQL